MRRNFTIVDGCATAHAGMGQGGLRVMVQVGSRELPLVDGRTGDVALGYLEPVEWKQIALAMNGADKLKVVSCGE